MASAKKERMDMKYWWINMEEKVNARSDNSSATTLFTDNLGLHLGIGRDRPTSNRTSSPMFWLLQHSCKNVGPQIQAGQNFVLLSLTIK
jgi:hypothetical protein